MTTREALTAAVLADPDADLPRLVYADHLDESGEPVLAGAIRFMCHHPDAACPVYRSSGAPRFAHLAPTWGVGFIRGLPGRYGRVRGWADARRHQPPAAAYPPLSGFTLRRGFIDAARLTLTAFVGGECRRCSGTGVLYDRRRRQRPCRRCEGEGHTPGVAGDLFASHPVRSVGLTDKHALPDDDGDGRPAWWQDDGDGPTYLPGVVFRLLPPDPGYTDPTPLRRSYPTAAAATAALSAALVAVGRSARTAGW